MNSNGWTNILLINVTVRHNKPEKTHSITTFMIANDPYLQQFVNKFTSQSAKALHRTERTREMILRIMKRIVKKRNKVVMHVCFERLSISRRIEKR
jgi:tRNA1(Val) A37 N6-methylase TrmN6